MLQMQCSTNWAAGTRLVGDGLPSVTKNHTENDLTIIPKFNQCTHQTSYIISRPIVSHGKTTCIHYELWHSSKPVRPDEMWLCSSLQGSVNSFVFRFSCFATLPTDSHCHRPLYLTRPMCISTWCIQKNVRWVRTEAEERERSKKNLKGRNGLSGHI